MGVDVSIMSGVGFTFEEKDLTDKWIHKNWDPDNYALEEAMEEYLERKFPALEFGTGGNYWTGKNLRHFVTVDRLTKHFYDQPEGGVYGVEKPVLRLEERNALSDASYRLTGKNLPIHSFLSVLYS